MSTDFESYQIYKKGLTISDELYKHIIMGNPTLMMLWEEDEFMCFGNKQLQYLQEMANAHNVDIEIEDGYTGY